MDEHFIKIHKWLYPVSWIYGAVVTVRNKLFDWGFLRSKSFDVPVICIGNLSVGGTGKTPHTEYLIKLLRNSYHVAVLSRGYKRHSRGYVLATSQSTAHSIGDEPYQMYTKFPSVTLAVDENRCHGIEQLLAIKEPSVEVVLLDDAFQHRYVKPGLSILLTDYHRLFCDDTLLPAGRLRESVNGKNRAQIVIVTKCPQDIKPIDYNIITKRLNLYPYQQLYFSSFRYGNLQPVFPSVAPKADSLTNELPLSALVNTDILLVTGIASPARMLEELKTYTDQIDLFSFEDHHHFNHRDMLQIKERFKRLKGTLLAMLEKIQETAAFLKGKMHTSPETAIILGTGLGSLADEITEKYEIKYSDIPNFPISTVEGHSGKLIFGKLGNKDIMAMQGRFHYYEGYSMKEVTFPVRVMRELGIKTLFVSNASGGTNEAFEIGDLMIITDHINYFPEHPLRGKNIPYGPRFPDMSEAYDKELIRKADEIAREKGIKVRHGIYIGTQGPTFETPAEYKLFHILGADAVGMSTVPEVIVANHCGIKVFGISVITDLGVEGKIVEVSHEEVQKAADAAQPKMTTIMRELINRA